MTELTTHPALARWIEIDGTLSGEAEVQVLPTDNGPLEAMLFVPVSGAVETLGAQIDTALAAAGWSRSGEIASDWGQFGPEARFVVTRG